jgi:hypothetical protein
MRLACDAKELIKLLFKVKLIYSIQVLGPWLWGNRQIFFSVVGQGKGSSEANAPPVHGIKNALAVWEIECKI